MIVCSYPTTAPVSSRQRINKRHLPVSCHHLLTLLRLLVNAASQQQTHPRKHHAFPNCQINKMPFIPRVLLLAFLFKVVLLLSMIFKMHLPSHISHRTRTVDADPWCTDSEPAVQGPDFFCRRGPLSSTHERSWAITICFACIQNTVPSLWWQTSHHYNNIIK